MITLCPKRGRRGPDGPFTTPTSVLPWTLGTSCAETSHLCVLRCFVDESSTPPVHEQHVPVGAADPAAMGLACSALAGCDLTEDVD